MLGQPRSHTGPHMSHDLVHVMSCKPESQAVNCTDDLNWVGLGNWVERARRMLCRGPASTFVSNATDRQHYAPQRATHLSTHCNISSYRACSIGQVRLLSSLAFGLQRSLSPPAHAVRPHIPFASPLVRCLLLHRIDPAYSRSWHMPSPHMPPVNEEGARSGEHLHARQVSPVGRGGDVVSTCMHNEYRAVRRGDDVVSTCMHNKCRLWGE